MEKIRSRYRELADHLKTKCNVLGVRLENFDSEIAEMTIAPGGRNITEQGLHLANLRYQGVLYIERISMSSAIMLMLYVRAWLDDNDDTRYTYKLDEPKVSMVKLDGDGELYDLLISAEFVDPVYLAPLDDQTSSVPGMIEVDGVKYIAGAYDLWIAETGAVNAAPLFPGGEQ